MAKDVALRCALCLASQVRGVQLSMARVKCALLSLKVLKAGAYGLPAPDEIHGQQ